MKKTFGNYLLDVSKLIFAGVILSNVFKDYDQGIAMFFGLIAVIVTLVIGLLLTKES